MNRTPTGSTTERAAVPWSSISAAAFLAALGLALAMAVPALPMGLVLACVLGGFAVVAWLLWPVLAVYALVLLAPFSMSFEVGGLAGVVVQDGVLLGMAATMAISTLGGSARVGRFSDPLVRGLLVLWGFLAVWGTITFIEGPANQYFLKGFVPNTWYVYRGVLRDLLPFPLALFCLKDRRSTFHVVDLLIAVTTVVSCDAIYQAGLTGEEATGSFDTKNQFAGFLVIVLPLVVARMLLAPGWSRRILYGLALPILLRGLWLAGSRGGLVALVAAFAALTLVVPRQRLLAFGTSAVLLLAVIVSLKTNILEKPMVRRYLTLGNAAEDDNYQWREEQWQLFLDRLKERPVMGTGSDVVESMNALDRAPTAHNGYLGVAMRSGVPATAAWVLLLLVLMVASARAALASADHQDRSLWAGFFGCLTALVVHNYVETTMLMSQVQGTIWVLTAGVLVLRHAPPARVPEWARV